MTTAWPVVLCLLQSPGWDVKPRVQQLAQDVAALQPMVEQIRVDRWQGPEAGRFENRKQSALDAVRQVRASAEAVAAAPESLSATVEMMSRLDTLLLDLSALSYGLSRYHSAAMADVVHAAVERLSAQRDSLRVHTEELAAARDAEFSVALREAQRCREIQVNRPAPRKQNQP